MLQNLHTHTTFCDGKDTPESIIQSAMASGFDSVGFSSHAPTSIHDDCEMLNAADYVNAVRTLKEKYKEKIKIFLGIELDYYSAGVLQTEGFDYKIGSVHYSRLNNGKIISYDHSAVLVKNYIAEDFFGDGLAYARSYYERLAQMPQVLSADFVGHFDLVTKFSDVEPELFDTDSKSYKSMALEALHAVREKMDFFEVNTGAIVRAQKKLPYPAPFILDEMKRLNCKLILTSDCHNKNLIDCRFKEAKEYIKAHGFDTLYYLTENGFVGEKI